MQNATRINSDEMENSFDRQAAEYDRRAGLPAQVEPLVVRSIAEAIGTAEYRCLLEIGTGTGQIGYRLQELPLQYVGFDISSAMLQRFRERFSPEEDVPVLLQADGNAQWPVADASTDVVFSSRALHWLDPNHVVSEVFRVAAPSGIVLLVGRVFRESDSVRAEMRCQMRQLLREQGIEGRSGEKSRTTIFESCTRPGAERLEPRTVARWTVDYTPSDSIESWQSKPGLAGRDVPDKTKQLVLERLRDWAVTQYGNLQRRFETEESYVLEGVKIDRGGLTDG